MIWFGTKVSPSIIQRLVGAPAFQGIDTKLVRLPQSDDPLSIRVNNLIAHLRDLRRCHMPVSISPSLRKLITHVYCYATFSLALYARCAGMKMYPPC